MAQAEYERKEELKYLKKKEMIDKLKKIREIAGIGEGGECRLDLEKEFDPEEHDKNMKAAFDDAYYEANDADPDFASDGGDVDGEIEKPDFDKEDDLLGLKDGWDNMNGSGGGFEAARETFLKQKAGKEEGVVEKKDQENTVEPKKKKKQNVSALEEELIKKELDEYYKLDYEGTIGDLKTRFKYRPVNAKRYGPKTKEVLLLDDKDLNQLVSLKKLAPYREKEWKVPHNVIHNQKLKIKSLLAGETEGQKTYKRKSRDD